jgi:hypothetical protein
MLTTPITSAFDWCISSMLLNVHKKTSRPSQSQTKDTLDMEYRKNNVWINNTKESIIARDTNVSAA